MTKYAVTLDQDNLPKGAEVNVQGLGTLVNGKAVEFTDEDESVFRQINGRLVDDRDKHGNITGYHFELGPTILQSFKSHATISAEKVTEESEDKQQYEDKQQHETDSHRKGGEK